jgi:radical SAM superfamily enzyme YgiQ (UPF0313 family)
MGIKMLINAEQNLRRKYENAFFKDHKIRYTFLKRLWNVSKTLCRASAGLRVYTSKFSKYDVLLINPAKLDGEKGIPVGIATMAAYLQKYGIKTLLLDLNVWPLGNTGLKLIIRKTSPAIIGIGSITYQIEEAYRLGQLIKNEFPKITLVYGGVHPTFVSDEAFKKGCADFVVIGEGEKTMEELCKALNSGNSDFSNVEGLAYIRNGMVIKNKQRQFIKNMNSLPFPAYYDLDIKAYNTDLHVYPHYKKRGIDMMESRGCPNNCGYCATPNLYRRMVRLKDAKNIIAEIEMLQKKHKMHYFHLHDDNFLLSRRRALEFCRLIKERNIKMKWLFLTDINTLEKNKDLIPKFADVGCISIELGIENADTNILKGLERHQNLKMLSGLNRLMRKAGITPLYLFMSFLPGETLDSTYKTSRLLDKLYGGKGPNIIEWLRPVHNRLGLGLCANPYPGSRFFDTAKDEGVILAESWRSYYPFNLSFVPYSFLHDVPIRKHINKEKFYGLLNEHYEEVLHNRTHSQKYDIFPKDNASGDYRGYIYSIFRLCDGKKTVGEIYNIFKNPKEKSLCIRQVCAAMRLLAVMGLVRSKKGSNRL